MILKSKRRSQTLSVREILEKERVIIPGIQREVVGTPDAGDWVFDEIFNLNGNGKEVSLLEMYFVEDNNSLEVYDGQQRLVYLYILIDVLNDFFADNKMDTMQNISLDFAVPETKDLFVSYKKKESAGKLSRIRKAWEDSIRSTLNGMTPSKRRSKLLATQECLLNSSVDAVFFENVEDAEEAFIFKNANNIPMKVNEVSKAQFKIVGKRVHMPVDVVVEGSGKDVLCKIIGYKMFKEMSERKSAPGAYICSLNKMGCMKFIKEISSTEESLSEFIKYCFLCRSLSSNNFMNIYNYSNRNDFRSTMYALVAANQKGLVKKMPKGAKDIEVTSDFFMNVMAPLVILSFTSGANGLRGSVFGALLGKIVCASIEGKSPQNLNEIILKYSNTKGKGYVYATNVSRLETYIRNNSNAGAALLHIMYATYYNGTDCLPNTTTLEHYLSRDYASKYGLNSVVNSLGNLYLLPREVNSSGKNHDLADKYALYFGRPEIKCIEDLHDMKREELKSYDGYLEYCNNRSRAIIEYLSKNCKISSCTKDGSFNLIVLKDK